jgi:hypothetical protein
MATHTLQAFDVTREPLAESLAHAERAASLYVWNKACTGLLAGLLFRAGDRERAEELLRRLSNRQEYGVPCALAIFHFLCSEIDAGAGWTEKALEQRDQMVPMILLTPPYGPMLRASSRRQALAKRMNLPDTV